MINNWDLLLGLKKEISLKDLLKYTKTINKGNYTIFIPKRQIRLLSFKKGKIIKTRLEYIVKYNYNGSIILLEYNNKKIYLPEGKKVLIYNKKTKQLKYELVNNIKKNEYLLYFGGNREILGIAYEDGNLIGISSLIGVMRVKNIKRMDYDGEVYDIKVRNNNYIANNIFIFS